MEINNPCVVACICEDLLLANELSSNISTKNQLKFSDVLIIDQTVRLPDYAKSAIVTVRSQNKLLLFNYTNLVNIDPIVFQNASLIMIGRNLFPNINKTIFPYEIIWIAQCMANKVDDFICIDIRSNKIKTNNVDLYTYAVDMYVNSHKHVSTDLFLIPYLYLNIVG